ncbi:ParA family protein [Oceanicella sp. SM1341]|uniref:ParA family protein n=1 Tax=Oceanicella sp. SM1341 TaxID=1548889 RepID=UPI000E51B4D6|nr:ParA family protein [Oceanicella sp. SM1341]
MKTILIANRKGGCGKTLTAITLASAFAQGGARVALADADAQKSALRWLKLRPSGLAPIRGLDWTAPGDFGARPKKLDWLVIDAPGALNLEAASALIGEAKAVVIPVLPSVFDADSTKGFLKEVEDLKRVRKGKARLHLLAMRVRPQARAATSLAGFFERIGQQPSAWVTERAAYGDLAAGGAALHDRPQKAYAAMKAQWQPLLDTLEQKG